MDGAVSYENQSDAYYAAWTEKVDQIDFKQSLEKDIYKIADEELI